MADKGKYVVLFTSGTFVFFKHKNEKGIFCPKNILNSTRQINKDDIYDLTIENVTPRIRSQYPDMPDTAAMIATKAKYIKTPRVIQGVGTIKKISQDGEYGFIDYQDGKTAITAFCTRITVRPSIEKGGMHKFFTTGGRVKFVAKEQPPSGMFNIEWRVVTATSMAYDISESNFEKVTPTAPASVTRPLAAAAASPSASALRPAVVLTTTTTSTLSAPPGLPGLVQSAAAGHLPTSSSVSSLSSSVANGVTYAARAASRMPDVLMTAVQKVSTGAIGSNPVTDENLPVSCHDPTLFGLSDMEKDELESFNFSCGPTAEAVVPIESAWEYYKKEDERSLESFEAELMQLSRVATALYGGDPASCPVSFGAGPTMIR